MSHTAQKNMGNAFTPIKQIRKQNKRQDLHPSTPTTGACLIYLLNTCPKLEIPGTHVSKDQSGPTGKSSICCSSNSNLIFRPLLGVHSSDTLLDSLPIPKQGRAHTLCSSSGSASPTGCRAPRESRKLPSS